MNQIPTRNTKSDTAMFRELPLIAISRAWLVIIYLCVVALLVIVSGELSS